MSSSSEKRKGPATAGETPPPASRVRATRLSASPAARLELDASTPPGNAAHTPVEHGALHHGAADRAQGDGTGGQDGKDKQPPPADAPPVVLGMRDLFGIDPSEEAHSALHHAIQLWWWGACAHAARSAWHDQICRPRLLLLRRIVASQRDDGHHHPDGERRQGERRG